MTPGRRKQTSKLLLSKEISGFKAKKRGASRDVHASSRDFLVANFILAIKRVYICDRIWENPACRDNFNNHFCCYGHNIAKLVFVELW